MTYDKFRRLRDSRLDRTAQAVRLMGTLANRQEYDYTLEEAEELVRTLQAAVNDVAAAFQLAPRGTTSLDRGVIAMRQRALDHSYAAWAFDSLRRGDTRAAMAHLRTALRGGHE